MTSILGLAVSRTRVSAVFLRGGVVAWSEARCCDARDRSDRIADLLAACPRSRWSPKRMIAAIGPSGVQVRRLSEVPDALDRKALAAVVRESVSRFFLKSGVPLETACGRSTDGALWAAAYDSTLLAEIDEACRSAGWRLDAVIPMASALGLATHDQSVIWEDDDLRLELTYSDGELMHARCSRAGTASSSSTPQPTRAFMNAGIEAADFLPAYSATQVRWRAPLLLKRPITLGSAPSRTHMAVAALLCFLAFLFLWIAPAVVSTARVYRARRELSALAPRLATAHRREMALDSVSERLSAVNTFEIRRRSLTLLLAEMTRALPDSCVILEMRLVDSADGTIVAAAPQASDVVDALERVPDISAPAIAGPVASISLGGRPLERLSATFRLNAP